MEASTKKVALFRRAGAVMLFVGCALSLAHLMNLVPEFLYGFGVGLGLVGALALLFAGRIR